MAEEIIIQINGERQKFPSKVTLQAVLAALNIEPKYVAIVLNETVVPYSLLSEKKLQAEDRIEILRAVAGG